MSTVLTIVAALALYGVIVMWPLSKDFRLAHRHVATGYLPHAVNRRYLRNTYIINIGLAVLMALIFAYITYVVLATSA
ncbi:MAG: hypothetical protein GY833_12895 [Aestuariibacter sp.]|nr:hypothetical protein [Aestuariibacter sp.]